MPKLHEREILIRQAEIKLREALTKLTDEFDLTPFEYIQLVQNILGGEILQTCKYQIRVERHGDANKPGGFE